MEDKNLPVWATDWIKEMYNRLYGKGGKNESK